jgi:hypothetical protein
MASKSLFESNPVLTLGAIVVLAVAADAFAARGDGGGGHGGGGGQSGGGPHGGGGGYHGGGLRSGGGAFRSGAPVHRGASTAHPDTAVRSGQVNAPVNVHHGVAFHRHLVHHRFAHRGFRVYSYDGCYRWRHVATPFGWTLRGENICSAYYGQYYY